MKTFKRNKNNKNYTVSVEYNEATILRQDFNNFNKACKWACKTIRAILVCNTTATILNNKTGEIMLMIER